MGYAEQWDALSGGSAQPKSAQIAAIPPNEQAAFNYVESARQQGLPAVAAPTQSGGFEVQMPGKYTASQIRSQEDAGPSKYADEWSALSGSTETQKLAANDPKAPPKLGLVDSAVASGVRQLAGLGKASKAVIPDVAGAAIDASPSIAKGAASVFDTAYGIVPGVLGGATYAISRALGKSPETSAESAATLSGAIDKPFGKAFGITSDPAYTGEASNKVMAFIGENIGKGSKWIADKTGLPVSDVENMANSIAMAAPGVGGRLGGKLLNGLRDVGKTAAEWKADINAKMDGKPAAAVPKIEVPSMQPREVVGGGSASVESNQYPVFTGEVKSEKGTFPVVKLSNITPGSIALPEQDLRAQVANEIVGNGMVRTGVRTGSEDLLRTEHTLAAKAGTDPNGPNFDPKALMIKEQIVAEQNALTKYAQQRIDATGASHTLKTPEARGEAINDVLHGSQGSLDTFFKDEKQKIYNSALQLHGDAPINSAAAEQLLVDPEFKAGLKLSNQANVADAAAELIQLAKTVGFTDSVSGIRYKPGSVAAWDAVRKAINASWTKDNAAAIRKINGAIDIDIAKAADPSLYKLGDAIHKTEKNIYSSEGIKNLFGKLDMNGVPTGEAFGKLPQKLNDLPLEQFRHIWETLDQLSKGRIRGAPEGMPDIPQELRQSAERAKSEIKGNLARQVYEEGAGKAGVWNQISVNKTLNGLVGRKINEIFTPDEVAKFHTLNYGGQFMPGVHSYEGSGQQINRMSQPGFLEKHIPNLAAILGAKTGILGGSVIAGKGGESIAGKMSKKRRIKEANAMNAEMEKNAQTGSTDIGSLNSGKK